MGAIAVELWHGGPEGHPWLVEYGKQAYTNKVLTVSAGRSQKPQLLK